MPPISLPARTQVPPELTWNIADIFPSDEAWEAELIHSRRAWRRCRQFQGHLGESPARLLEWFNVSGPLRLAVSQSGDLCAHAA